MLENSSVKVLVVVSIMIGLFLVILFLDQNSAPVPVKIILGDPRPIGLSTVILASMLVGVSISLVAGFAYRAVRKSKENKDKAD